MEKVKIFFQTTTESNYNFCVNSNDDKFLIIDENSDEFSVTFI